MRSKLVVTSALAIALGFAAIGPSLAASVGFFVSPGAGLTFQQKPGAGDRSGSDMDELEWDLMCGEGAWLVIYDEDENGDRVEGTEQYDCVPD